MNANIDKVVDKVKKLLAKAEGTIFEEEALSYTEKAFAILAEHNLSMSDIKTNEKEKFETDEQLITETALWVRPIIIGVAELYFCKTFYIRVRPQIKLDAVKVAGGYYRDNNNGFIYLRHMFVGTPGNIAIAKEMSIYLLHTVGRILKEKLKIVPANERNRFANSFLNACSLRLQQRLLEKKHQAEKGEIKTFTGTNLPALRPMYLEVSDYYEKLSVEMGVKVKTKAYRTSNLDGAKEGRNAANNIGLEQQVGKQTNQLLQ